MKIAGLFLYRIENPRYMALNLPVIIGSCALVKESIALDHLPYLSDIAPADSFLFSHLKWRRIFESRNSKQCQEGSACDIQRSPSPQFSGTV